jgi:hypothetical protein
MAGVRGDIAFQAVENCDLVENDITDIVYLYGKDCYSPKKITPALRR